MNWMFSHARHGCNFADSLPGGKFPKGRTGRGRTRCGIDGAMPSRGTGARDLPLEGSAPSLPRADGPLRARRDPSIDSAMRCPLPRGRTGRGRTRCGIDGAMPSRGNWRMGACPLEGSAPSLPKGRQPFTSPASTVRCDALHGDSPGPPAVIIIHHPQLSSSLNSTKNNHAH
jgi:hypothetical protein